MNDFFQVVSLKEFFINLQNSMNSLAKNINQNKSSLDTINKTITSINNTIFTIMIENFGAHEIVRNNAYTFKYVILDNEDVIVVRCSTELENTYNRLGIQPISYIFNKE